MARQSLEKLLTDLIRKVDPGELRLGIPKFAAGWDEPHFDLTINTRGYQEGFVATSVGDAIRDAHDNFDPASPDYEKVIPRWDRLSRMQREVVEQVLKEHRARHMARAAEANLNHSRDAAAQYQMADAFAGALDALDVPETDKEGHWTAPSEPLVPVVASEREQQDVPDQAPAKRAKAAENLEKLRRSNKEKTKPRAG